MIPASVVITGVGSVSPYGVVRGPVTASEIQPKEITAWKHAGQQRAFIVEPFQPSSFVKGLNVRRLDPFSAWSLVAASLALEDAAIDWSRVERSRVAIVLATRFGCLGLTGAMFASAATNGWSGTDPIVFPETLPNSAASHIAIFHQLRGPNITLSSSCFAGEQALLLASRLLRSGAADLAVVLTGETLTEPLFVWYEQAGLLSSECFSEAPSTTRHDFIPSEGIAALVLERNERDVGAYARLISGSVRARGDEDEALCQTMSTIKPSAVLCTRTSPWPATHHPPDMVNNTIAREARAMASSRVADGLPGAGALFQVISALSQRERETVLMVGRSERGGHSSLYWEQFGR